MMQNASKEGGAATSVKVTVNKKPCVAYVKVGKNKFMTVKQAECAAKAKEASKKKKATTAKKTSASPKKKKAASKK
jgi:hypothetical protein